MNNKNSTTIICILSVIIVALICSLIKLKVHYSKYKMYKNIISQDEVEKTLFGQKLANKSQ